MPCSKGVRNTFQQFSMFLVHHGRLCEHSIETWWWFRGKPRGEERRGKEKKCALQVSKLSPSSHPLPVDKQRMNTASNTASSSSSSSSTSVPPKAVQLSRATLIHQWYSREFATVTVFSRWRNTAFEPTLQKLEYIQLKWTIQRTEQRTRHQRARATSTIQRKCARPRLLQHENCCSTRREEQKNRRTEEEANRRKRTSRCLTLSPKTASGKAPTPPRPSRPVSGLPPAGT